MCAALVEIPDWAGYWRVRATQQDRTRLLAGGISGGALWRYLDDHAHQRHRAALSLPTSRLHLRQRSANAETLSFRINCRRVDAYASNFSLKA